MASAYRSAWLLVLLPGCGSSPQEPALTLYSGRSEALVAPLVDRFRSETQVDVRVRYGGTAELAALIIEEGDDTEADIYYGQDAGALGALAREGRLRELPRDTLERVDSRFRARDGRWVGVSGRARVLIYNTERVAESELPRSAMELTDSRFKRRLGWAPSNGSFQAFVTAMRVLEGDEATRGWLERMLANEPRSYPDNDGLFDATVRGEVDIGLTNHYYLLQFRSQASSDPPVRNYSPADGGAGALVNLAGVGIVTNTNEAEVAQRFVDFLLSRTSQIYFSERAFEYPLTIELADHPSSPPLSEIRTPELDLSELSDLVGTLELLHETGVL